MKNKWQVGVILAIGVLAVSTAAIFIRLSMQAAGIRGVGFSLFLAASRLSLAAIILLPAWKNLKFDRLSPAAYYYATAAGTCLALHFASWISSLSFTSIAASTTLVTTNPIWVGLISWLWLKEKSSKLTLIGISVATIGGILIALADSELGRENNNNPALGNFLALIGAWMASLYLLLGRQAQREGLNINAYIAIAYSTAAIILLPLPLLFGSSYLGYPNLVYLYIFLMAILAQLVGHTSFNWSVRWISPTLVSLVLLFEPLIASFLGWLVFGEIPHALVCAGAVILITGVAVTVFDAKK